MKKILFVILAICFLAGCTEKEDFRQQLGIPEVDENELTDLYCFVSCSSGKDVIVGGETAKELYILVSEYADSASRIDDGMVAGEGYIHMSFKQGYFSDAEEITSYGSFIVSDKNEIWISASPEQSFGIMYDAKWGTYKKIMDYLEDV